MYSCPGARAARAPGFLLLRCALILAFLLAGVVPAQKTPPEGQTITIDARGASHAFPHFWEEVVGSGRANLSLRADYREDLRALKKATSIEYVRFHAIFDDENGVYDEDSQGRPLYNFTYVDQIYDGLLKNGFRPFVELSFMPKKLAASDIVQSFWYKPIVSPPKDYNRWGDLIYTFASHLVSRYGADEVARWYFEVWNEPNLDFWAGIPKQETYYRLYEVTARALKRVDSRIRVGGPATAQAAWVSEFIAHCSRHDIPLDFVSTHVYGNDTAQNVFGRDERIPRREMVALAVKKIYEEVKHSARPGLPIHWTEYNASYKNEVDVTDSPFMGPWLANNIRQCDGFTTTMSYWTFSDVFEEQGVAKTPFCGGFGLIAVGRIPKASFTAFRLLHLLGEERIDVADSSALATRRKDGTLVVAVWNYVPAGESGPSRKVRIGFQGLSEPQCLRVYRLDADHGSALTVWEGLGRPAFPTREQQAQLREAGQLPAPKRLTVRPGEQPVATLDLPPHGLAVVEVSNK